MITNVEMSAGIVSLGAIWAWLAWSEYCWPSKQEQRETQSVRQIAAPENIAEENQKIV